MADAISSHVDITAYDQLYAGERRAIAQYELLTLVHTDDRDTLLTDRQRECLIAAQREGYFAVPRACTLEDLAETLGVDKSTASETIRRGTSRVISQFFLDRD